MSQQGPPIKLKFAKQLFRLIFDLVDVACFDFTQHFRERMTERGIDHLDVQEALKNGYIAKEHKPDSERPFWRWELRHKSITIIFAFNFDTRCVSLITCWKGKKPQGEKP